MGLSPPQLATAARRDACPARAATARARTPSSPAGGATAFAMTKVRAVPWRPPETRREGMEDEGKEEGLATFILRS